MRSLEDQRLIERLTVERDAALKACAEMRDAMECDDDDVEAWNHALSSDCGRGYHADSEWRPVVAALQRCIERLDDAHHHQTLKMAREALAHAEKLMGKGKE